MKPKVMIITMGLSRIVEPIVNNHQVVGVIECAPRDGKESKKNIFYKLTKFLYTKIKSNEKILKSYVQSRDIPYYYMDSGSDKSLENWVKSIDPDVIIVFSMSQLLKENIFKIPKYGTINLHPALLPSYRGPFPNFWVYFNMDRKSGVTVHYIDSGEDSGDIIYQESYEIPLGMKSPVMLDHAIGTLGVNLLLKVLDNIEELPREVQPSNSPTLRARNIKDEEHKNLIEWKNWKIERIWHLLRGTELWLNSIPSPRGIYRGQRWSVEQFEKCDTSRYKVSQLYKEDGQNFVVCNDGKIYLDLNFSFKKFILNIVR